MSNIELDQGKSKIKMKQPASRGSAPLAILLALLAATTAIAIAYSLRSDIRPTLLIGLGAFAFIGLLALLAAFAGLLQFGKARVQNGMATQLLDRFDDACVVTDEHGRTVYGNKAYRELAKGYSDRRLPGIDKLYAGYSEISGHIYRLTQAVQDKVVREEYLRLSAGSAAAGARADVSTWLKVSVASFQTNENKNMSLWRIVDVTDERAAQEAAFQQLQHIIDYLDHAPAGFFSADENQRIQYINATLAGWLAIDLTKTTGGVLGLEDILAEGVVEQFGGEKLEANEERTESHNINLKTGSGAVLPVRVIHRVSTDDEGVITGSQSLVLNQAPGLEVIADGESDGMGFAQFINSAPIAIAKVDGKGQITEANTEFSGLFGKQSMTDDTLTSLVWPEAGPLLEVALTAAAQGQAGLEPVEFVIAEEKGRRDHVNVEGAPQRTGRFYISALGAVEGPAELVVYAIDTTEQKSLEAQFIQSQKMQAVGQLAGGVAHDFNNVLTAIIGFSDLLLARHMPTDPSFQDIMNIKQNANRAANLVRQLLAFSRRQTLRPKVLSLSDVLSDLSSLLGRLLGEKITLKTVHGRDLGYVKVDINQFEQVIVNLAVNARDAMPDGGELTVKTANISKAAAAKLGHNAMPPGEYILCEVADTGTGMEKDVLDKIYEPFFSTKEVGKGTGLGLSTVYGIVKQTGGFIFAESAEGKGTVFRIYLPRCAPEEVAAIDHEDVKPEPKTDLTGEGTILLVEDEDAVRAFAERALASRGYKVLGAASGEEALDVVADHGGEIDLIISDVVMPVMDGPTLLNKLRERDINTKVIFISGYAEEAFDKNLSEGVTFSFLPKPFSLKQLAGAVKEAMEEGA